MANFILRDENSLEVRALEPTSEGFLFRLAKDSGSFFDLKPLVCQFYFFDFSSRSYKDCTVFDFEISPAYAEDYDDINYVTFSFKSQDKIFLEYFTKLLKDYTKYINYRLTLDDLDVTEVMTGQKVSDFFPADMSDFKASVTAGQPSCPYKLSPVELAVSLDNLVLMKAFLSMDYPDFCAYYWKENGLANHPISDFPITHIYIGNQFCPLIFPEDSLLYDLLRRTYALGLKAVIVFSTMPEHLTDITKHRLRLLQDFSRENSLRLELVINDYGTCSIIKKLMPDTFDLTLGILLNKRKKDSRMTLQPKASTVSTDALFFREYLKTTFNITSYSQEACGYRYEMTGNNNIYHLPAYQTNTSGFCTLFALCKNGDRSKQEAATSCPHYCENKSILYPSSENSFGRFNSLFGVSMTELNDSDFLNKLIETSVKRLVVRL